MKKLFFIGMCCAICSQQSFASQIFDKIHPFITAEMGATVNAQNNGVMEKYGVPYSTLSSDGMNFTYGGNFGIRFLDDSHIYHPGIQMFYNHVTGDAKLDVASAYGSTKFNIDTSHNLFGAEFDNYIRIDEQDGQQVFIVLGLDAGTIRSTYTPEFINTDIKDNGNFYGAKIEYVAEDARGFGLSISMKFLKTDTEALSHILLNRIGLRYTF
jgi:hypothetical protein